MPVTLRQIARLARVSIGTVSRVLHDAPDVNPELRQRVGRILRESGYRPGFRIRPPAPQRARSILFMIANRPVLQPFNAWALNGAMEYCADAGFLLAVERFHYSAAAPLTANDLPRSLRTEGAVDAVILAGTNHPNLAACLDSLAVPYVLVGNSYCAGAAGGRVDQVRFDHRAGGRQVTEYLLQLGHRNIWYVGDLSLPWYEERFGGYCAAMQSAGLEPRSQVDGLSDDRFMNGMHSAASLLDRREPVTAIIGSTNEVAYGVWETLDRRKLSVPGDISLAGFDDEHTTHKSRPLTAIGVDAEEEGRQLARMAVAKAAAPGTVFPEVVIPAHLLKHNTCRPLSPTL